jgi:hypothetical protein
MTMEGSFYAPAMLSHEWSEFENRYLSLCKTGFTNMAIMELVIHVRKDYATQLFPGSSLGKFLLSKPDADGRLNFQQTLFAEKDWLSDKVTLAYQDFNTSLLTDSSRTHILWRTECYSGEELIERFEEFVRWNKSWNLVKK